MPLARYCGLRHVVAMSVQSKVSSAACCLVAVGAPWDRGAVSVVQICSRGFDPPYRYPLSSRTVDAACLSRVVRWGKLVPHCGIAVVFLRGLMAWWLVM